MTYEQLSIETGHGSYSIEVKENHIYTQLNGAFNEQGVSNWVQEMKKVIASLSPEPFTILVDELKATGATPQALKLANAYNQWLNKKPLIAKAVVYSGDMFKAIDIKNLPARQEQNIKFFNNSQDAKVWLDKEAKRIG
ncbi:hypothetical protein HII17_14145 [Thalassotalea sp. M1531]|uniref:STAS/SEC14 domain-containing protein n=1 Tax=Thalassotalea algicola TaxID=2716224 RepID=A0A7Y0LEG3_9GAMM|nr:hypothetical protein [Thalassotalea algicola]NMP32699.1 hypothetical protein [Thalassotalea algicola]